MILSPVRIIAAAFAALAVLALPAGAAAATPAQIHADAADGVIDGTYSLGDMRAADKVVGAVQREYHGWDDTYRAYLRDMVKVKPTGGTGGTHPGSGPTTANTPSRSGTSPRGRTLGSSGKARGAQRHGDTARATDRPTARSIGANGELSSADAAAPGSDVDDVPGEAIVAAGPGGASSDSASSGFPFALLLAGAVPLLVLATGGWQMARARRAANRNADSDADFDFDRLDD